MSTITLWKPEPDVVIHQALGKSLEEANELGKILARCLIQGIDAGDPGTGKANREALAEEIADVHGALRWLLEVIGQDLDAARAVRKMEGFRLWQKMLEEDGCTNLPPLDTPQPSRNRVDPDVCELEDN